MMALGYEAEAEALVSWLLHSTRLTRPELSVVYDVFGRSGLEERTLDHLEGYAGSRPVRIGNGATGQFQLDVYGQVLDAVFQFLRRHGNGIDRAVGRMLVGWGDTVCRRWREPDEGIWEIRAEPRQHTYSKVMAWVALDRLVRLHESSDVEVPVERFRSVKEEIRQTVETEGYDADLQSYVATLGGAEVDASLLLLSRYGYADPGSERMRGTCALVDERLGRKGLVRRYAGDDGLDGLEGAFGASGYWAVSSLAMQGSVARAGERFEGLLARANDVGLYAEEVDPQSGAALGNFPQAFTHVGLIDAALTLRDCEEGRVTPPPLARARSEDARGALA